MLVVVESLCAGLPGQISLAERELNQAAISLENIDRGKLLELLGPEKPARLVWWTRLVFPLLHLHVFGGFSPSIEGIVNTCSHIGSLLKTMLIIICCLSLYLYCWIIIATKKVIQVSPTRLESTDYLYQSVFQFGWKANDYDLLASGR